MIDPVPGDGRLASTDAVLEVASTVLAQGPGRGNRRIDVRAMGGIDIRVLVDRGFDLGPAWYRGVPLSWLSRVGETRPLDSPKGMEWAQAFGGGLMVTCGLRNVGAPSEGHGLHGTFSHMTASDVGIERVADGNGLRCVLTARITDADAVSSHLEVRRTITSWVGRGAVEVLDRTENLGSRPEPAPILYHFNFGYPLWSGAARLDAEIDGTVPRDEPSERLAASWRVPPPVEEAHEAVLEHRVVPTGGECRASLLNPDLGVGVHLTWDHESLPRFHQWIQPSPGVYALGLEPSNASTRGRGHDREEGRLPFLEPGQVRETRVALEAVEL